MTSPVPTTPAAAATTASPAPAPLLWGPIRSQPVRAKITGSLTTLTFSPQGQGFASVAPVINGYTSAPGYERASQVRSIDLVGKPGKPFKLRQRDGELSGAVYGSHALLVLGPFRRAPVLWLRTLSASGRLGGREAVPVQYPWNEDRVCSDSSGNAVVAWSEDRGKGRSSVLAMAQRTARGRISSRQQLSATTPYAFSCTIGAGGRWAIAAAVRPSGGDNTVPHLLVWTGQLGSRATRRVDVGAAPYATDPTLAIDGAGRTYLVLRNQIPDTDFFANAESGPYRLRATSISPDGRTVAPLQPLAAGYGYGGYPDLMASPASGAVLTVTGPPTDADPNVAKPTPLSLSTATADGTFSALAPIDGATDPGPMAYRSGTTAVLTWSNGDDKRLLAATLTGGQLGPASATGLTAGEHAALSRTASGGLRLSGVLAGDDAAAFRSTTLVGP